MNYTRHIIPYPKPGCPEGEDIIFIKDNIYVLIDGVSGSSHRKGPKKKWKQCRDFILKFKETFLKIEHDNQDDEMRMWLPDFKKIRRISSKRRGDSFMASDLSYEDLASREIEKYHYERKEDEAIDGVECFVVEVRPSDKVESSYQKHLSWINKSTLSVVKEESFDKRGELLKVKNFTHKKIKDYYIMSEIYVENVQKNHSTKLTIDKMEVDLGVKASLFQEKNLKRLPR